ncbi:polyadenylate-binding protein 1-like [Clarias magur]|uniref:Polyadenylate-binding protein 1-like n=1 Tax=Clarias magur TaxID=1594786 RepID=A0A8J4UAJ5_CLAMG|nr:polyadenylate-binding protein 1-like [Clarias magur]
MKITCYPWLRKSTPVCLLNKITWILVQDENNYEIMNMIRDPELLRARVHAHSHAESLYAYNLGDEMVGG